MHLHSFKRHSYIVNPHLILLFSCWIVSNDTNCTCPAPIFYFLLTANPIISLRILSKVSFTSKCPSAGLSSASLKISSIFALSPNNKLNSMKVHAWVFSSSKQEGSFNKKSPIAPSILLVMILLPKFPANLIFFLSVSLLE